MVGLLIFQTGCVSARSPAAAGSWPAMHLRLVIGIVLSSLAGLIISGLAVCCCMRCRRRAREGRLGSRLPAWLLPTPSPQRRQGSPLNLRNKYFGARNLCAPCAACFLLQASPSNWGVWISLLCDITQQ